MRASQYKAVVIGASAGALDALSKILPTLPENCPFPIMVVVHLPVGKDSLIAELFQKKCRVRVCEAEDKMPLEPGVVYFAPPDYHLLVEKNYSLSLSADDPVLYSRPSVDVLFEAAADAYGPDLIGIVLTGANNDGAQGLKAICDKGGLGLVQEPESAYASAMPRAALALCPDARAMSLEKIAAFLQGEVDDDDDN